MTATTLNLPIPLDKLRQILRDYGVIEASVFGSYARGEQTPKSDLDLFISCKRGVTLFDVFDLQALLEKQTGKDVDLVTKINPNFAEYIEPDLVDLEV